MSYPVDNGINSGPINNHTQHPYPYPYPQSQQRHQLPQHGQPLPQQQQQQQATPSFGLVSPFHNDNSGGNDNNNTYTQNPQSTFPLNPAYNRSSFGLGSSAYGAVPPGALAPQEQDTSLTNTAVPPPKPLSWDSQSGTSSHQHAGLSIGTSSYQPDMRYIKGPLDVLNAEQYNDGRFTGTRGLYKPEAHALPTAAAASNPKKRGRKVSQNDRVEPVEEIKRARGRPRLEAGDHQDMKERRKEQIRMAQRAYRYRKETTINHLAAKVAGLEAGNHEVNADFQKLMEYVNKHDIATQNPELGRRLQQFQSTLTQRCPETASPGDDDTASDAKPREDSALPDQSQMKSQTPSSRLESQSSASLPTTQPQPLLGGIIVTHEPEAQPVILDSAHPSDASIEDGTLTFVRMANIDNASFGYPLNFLDSSMQTPWSLPWEPLSILDSGAYLERTFGRRLHRRTTERAAKLLSIPDLPVEAILRVFGFVIHYASLDEIKQRIKSTLSRGADEDMNAYAQPFHHVGGSGTHFAGGAKTIAFPEGAPFPNSGFGMGPFNEKTTTVRDDLLDHLQHAKLPGWEGEWFDAYEVEQYLAQQSISLPQGGGDGYVDIPPGEFYDNPLEEPQAKSSNGGSSGGMQGGPVRNNPAYPSPGSSIEGLLSVPAPTDLWSPGSLGPDYLASMSDTMSSAIAYHNTGSLGFADASQYGYAASSSAMNLVSSQARNKRVWFSVDKFIESLGAKCTCVGKGPAFRKKDVVAAFWEAAKPGPE
ncbi:hypothetical protein F5B22DRAFT_87019 [Xylaria bambusicola]|uniref:uncharacterized protein n=1 Tax=Xylaria bambusicola TaxID=326684 RepID=UPI0020074D57|nr:uncharacterized protein F5B22DRAFT_87019 [Xylaria bambusicola]KAI0517984.1 hypothetical protein F5B22DRAFT_87019 [Xylaria bambusicola]